MPAFFVSATATVPDLSPKVSRPILSSVMRGLLAHPNVSDPALSSIGSRSGDMEITVSLVVRADDEQAASARALEVCAADVAPHIPNCPSFAAGQVVELRAAA